MISHCPKFSAAHNNVAPLFCPENRPKNRDIVPGLAHNTVLERVPTGSRIIIDTSGENKLTSATKQPSFLKKKKKEQPCVAPDGLVNHEFSTGQSHARSTAIIKRQLMENCRRTPLLSQTPRLIIFRFIF